MDLYHFADHAPQQQRFPTGANCKKFALQESRMTAIAEPIARRHGFSMKDMKGHDRRRTVATARQEIMHALMAECLWSSLTIGQFLGGRDHTTVLHGVQRHEERLRKVAA